MEIEDIIKSGNMLKYGFFFWIMLSGVLILILSIIHGFAPRYAGLGIIFFTGGIVGYCFSELMDRISSHTMGSKPTLKFHVWVVVIKFLILIAIVIVAQCVYHFFPIAPAFLKDALPPK